MDDSDSMRSLYVRRNVLNVADVLTWAAMVGLPAPRPAEKLHVTLIYSRRPVDWAAVPRGQDAETVLLVPPGNDRTIARLGQATVLVFDSAALAARHHQLRAAGADWDHEGFQPHITVTYAAMERRVEELPAYTGEIALGPEVFAEVPR